MHVSARANWCTCHYRARAAQSLLELSIDKFSLPLTTAMKHIFQPKYSHCFDWKDVHQPVQRFKYFRDLVVKI